MADLHSELEFKFKDYPNIKYKMLRQPVFHPFLMKMTEEQMALVEDALDDRVKIVWVNARSGTGKTMMAVMVAYALYLNSGKNQELLYVASPVQEDALGFTAGSIKQKESKYMSPLHDALEELNMNPEQVIRDDENLENQKENEVWCNTKTHSYVRGTNVKGKTVILDESQNNTKNELKKILTRIHDDSKVFVIGHDRQNDLKDPRKSGFVPYLKWFEGEPYSKVHELHHNFRGKLAQKADDFEW